MASITTTTPVVLVVTFVAVVILSASTAQAAAAGGEEEDSLVKACNVTQKPQACVDVLKPNPEAATASVRKLGELGLQYVLRAGPELSAEAERVYKEVEAGASPAAAGSKEEKDELRACLDSLKGEVGGYKAVLEKVPADDVTDAKVAGDAQFILHEQLSVPAASGTVCGPYSFKACPVVDKIYLYEDMLQVTLDLLTKAGEEEAGKKDAGKKDNNEHLRAICNGTENEKVCLEVLTAVPEAKEAKTRQLAELAYLYVVKKGPELAKEAAGELEEAAHAGGDKSKVAESRDCVAAVKAEIESCNTAMEELIPKTREEEEKKKKKKIVVTDGTLVEAKRVIRGVITGGAAAANATLCGVRPYTEYPVVNKVVQYKEMMKVTMNLISMSGDTNPTLADPNI